MGGLLYSHWNKQVGGNAERRLPSEDRWQRNLSFLALCRSFRLEWPNTSGPKAAAMLPKLTEMLRSTQPVRYEPRHWLER